MISRLRVVEGFVTATAEANIEIVLLFQLVVKMEGCLVQLCRVMGALKALSASCVKWFRCCCTSGNVSR